MIEENSIHCSNCLTTVLNNEEQCPNCNSPNKTIELSFEDKVSIRDQIHGKVIDDTFTKKKKTRIDFISGDEQSYNGDWVNKERIIDKINNHYFEQIKDDKGNIIHFCSEKLTEHIGHGNAKFDRETNAS